MSHSTPEQPTFGEHDESDALPSDAIAAAKLDDLRDRRVYAARLGCVLHILHIAVTAGMTSTFFMGPLGKGPWNEWERDHAFSLLGLVWYNTSRSDSCCPVLDSNFALLLENLRRARVAEAPKARLVFFCGADLVWGADFFSGAGEEVVSMATPETMTKRRFLTHPFSTVAYAMRVLFFVLCALKPKEVYSKLRFSIFGATLP